MTGSFNTREFFHGAPEAVFKLIKWLFLVTVFPVPIFLLSLGMAADAVAAVATGYRTIYCKYTTIEHLEAAIAAMRAAIQALETAGVKVVELPVSHAFHSYVVAPASAPLPPVPPATRRSPANADLPAAPTPARSSTRPR